MREAVYLSLESALSRMKGRAYKIDRKIPLSVLLMLALRRLIWLLRGVAKTTVLQLRPRAIFVASGVQFRNSSMCRFGSGVTLERGVIIDGLSEHGIDLGPGVLIGAYSLIRSSTAMHLGEGMTIGKNSGMRRLFIFWRRWTNNNRQRCNHGAACLFSC